MRTDKFMRIMIAVVAFAVIVAALATPSPNNYVAVTNDWYNGNWSNVYELAQTRFAANSNDLVAANIMVEYDIMFSDHLTMSNSIIRYMRISDAATLPAYTNVYQRVRLGWEIFLNEFLPSRTEADLLEQRTKSYIPHKDMNCDFVLKILWDNGAW